MLRIIFGLHPTVIQLFSGLTICDVITPDFFYLQDITVTIRRPRFHVRLLTIALRTQRNPQVVRQAATAQEIILIHATVLMQVTVMFYIL